jgi:hypothetical protein
MARLVIHRHDGTHNPITGQPDAMLRLVCWYLTSPGGQMEVAGANGITTAHRLHEIERIELIR